MGILFWQCSIVVKEYGHFLALLAAPALVWRLRKGVHNAFHGIQILACLIAPIFLFQPLFSAYRHQTEWKSALQTAFAKPGDATLPRLIDFTQLWKTFPPFRQKPLTLQFSEHNGEKLLLDLYLPDPLPELAPVVVIVHGGGWDTGDRTQLPELNSILAHAGYAVAAISYRLAPGAHWPAQREDVKAAIDYLKTVAPENHLDFSRWAILGRSAGGQIAESIAYQEPDPGLKGCIAYYAPADLNFAYQFGVEDDALKSLSLLRNYLGGTPTEVSENYNSASPIDFVTTHSVPTLLFHGPHDPLVWYKQSERLHERLDQNSVRNAFITLNWATHGFDYNINGPAGQVSTNATLYFLEQILR